MNNTTARKVGTAIKETVGAMAARHLVATPDEEAAAQAMAAEANISITFARGLVSAYLLQGGN